MRPRVVFVTGPPGVGKTYAVQRGVLRLHKPRYKQRWAIVKYVDPERANTQVVYHRSKDGSVVVIGPYRYDHDVHWPKPRRGTTPANGGSDRLQSHATNLVAALLRGELSEPAPQVVVIESCSAAKVNRVAVLDALLDAPELRCVELVRPRGEAIAAVRDRDRAVDGKAVAGMSAAKLHDSYGEQVESLKAALHKHAAARGTDVDFERVEWRDGADKLDGLVYRDSGASS